jgi:hypothetical protein
MPSAWRSAVALSATLCVLSLPLPAQRASAEPAVAGSYPYRTYLPVLLRQETQGCTPIPEEIYDSIPVDVRTPDPGVPAELHPDLNLDLRGYRDNFTAFRGLVDYSGGYDPNAPRLQTLFAGSQWRSMSHVYQVYQWDGGWPGVYGVYPITSPDVTLAGLVSTRQEKVYVPDRPPEIFHDTVTGNHYVAMVLYAAPDRITIKYTRDDHVITGYTVHIEGICVEPRLVALYNASASAGRTYLPGLRYGQAIGRASGSELGVAIRDVGTFMDPRSRKDWWQGLAAGEMDVPSIDASGEVWFVNQQARLAPGALPETER